MIHLLHARYARELLRMLTRAGSPTSSPALDKLTSDHPPWKRGATDSRSFATRPRRRHVANRSRARGRGKAPMRQGTVFAKRARSTADLSISAGAVRETERETVREPCGTTPCGLPTLNDTALRYGGGSDEPNRCDAADARERVLAPRRKAQIVASGRGHWTMGEHNTS